MIQRLFVLMFLGISLTFAPPAQAQRSGFIISFGVGPGLASYSDGRPTKGGVATDLQIGGVIGDGLELYYLNKVIFHGTLGSGSGDIDAMGVNGVGVTYPLDSGLYINGGVGVGAYRRISSTGSSSNETGLGLVAGAGYALSDRFGVDADLLYTSLDDFGNVLGFKISLHINSH